jgi:hypothetical protein
MRLAKNVFVHDPEINQEQIDSKRLRAHGWPEELVQQHLRQRQQESSKSISDIRIPLPKVE